MTDTDTDSPTHEFEMLDQELVARTWGIDADHAKSGRELAYIRDWVDEHRSLPVDAR